MTGLRQRPEPYRQGDLDGFCGVYAIINALRLAVWKSGARAIADEEWIELFHVLLAEADETIGAVTLAAAGIEPKPFRQLLGLAAQYMFRQHDVLVTITRPLKCADVRSLDDVTTALAAGLQKPGSALIVCLMGHHGHWTVVHRVTPTSLQLFDSDGLTRVALANCRLKGAERRAGRREHVLRRSAVLAISIAHEA